MQERNAGKPAPSCAGNWSAPPPPPPTSPRPPVGPIHAGQDFEEHVLATWFPRLGAIALLIGAIFGFKYGIDQGWIGPSLRVMLGFAAAAALIGTGEWALGKHWTGYAQSAAGGGIALAYLSTWVALEMYGLVSPAVAFGGFVLVSAGGVALAMRHDSLPLAILGVATSFATPLVAGSEALPETMSYVYVVGLNLAILSLAAVRDWRVLDGLAFGGSWLLFVATSLTTGGSVVFAGSIFAIFAALPFLRRATKSNAIAQLKDELVVINTITFFAALTFTAPMASNREVFVGLLAVACTGLAWAAARLFPTDERFAVAHVSVAVLVVTAWPLLALGFEGVLAFWAVEAAVLVAAACAWRVAALGEATGLALIGLSITGTLVRMTLDYSVSQLIFNVETLVIGLQVGSLVAIGALLKRSRLETRDLHVPATLSAHFLTLGWMTLEALSYFTRVDGVQAVQALGDPQLQLAWSGLWALYAAGVLTAGIALNSRLLRVFSICVLAATLTKMAVHDLWMLENLHRLIGFAGIGVILLASSLMFHRFRDFVRGPQRASAR